MMHPVTLRTTGRRACGAAAAALAVSACLAAWLLAARPAAPAADAGDKPATPAEYECRWAGGPITLDGKADEDAWKHAATIDRFYLPWLGKDGRPARTATKAKLLWDRDYLYFFAEMEDADLYADVTEHDGMTWFNDVFELFFKPADDKPGYYEFQVNAAGTVMDMYLPRRGAGGYGRFRKDGDFHVDAKVRLRGTLNNWHDRDEGWSVEGRIPWKDFHNTGGRPAEGARWKFALCRYDYSVDFEGPDLSTNAPLSVGDFHHFEDYATLRFAGPPDKGGGGEEEADKGAAGTRPYGIATRTPLTTSTVVGSPEPPPPYRVKRLYPKLKLNFPIAVTHQPGSDRLFVITQVNPYGPSTVSRVKDDPEGSEVEKLFDVEAGSVAYDIKFHPKFADNGYVYIGSNVPSKALGGQRATRITRYVVDRKPPYKFDLGSATTIIEWASDGHNGGATAFGHDGMMYVTSGDGTSDSDMNIRGQDLSQLTAKVLRIDVDHPDPGKTYSVPRDNPFVGVPGARSETWAYGLRNPWRMTVDDKTGALWVGNNGQDLWEQAYRIERGANYGWSVMEGSHVFYPNRKAGPTPFSKPTVEHHHSEARSLTGGLVYYGPAHPELHGVYVYGDYSTGKVWGVRHDGKRVTWHKELADTHLQITGFGTDGRGEILIADHRGEGKGGFYSLEATPKDVPPSTFPRKLSESGLFKSVKGHEPVAALIPYSINAPFWSDGAYKVRYVGLPGTAHADFARGTNGWNFPDRTVIVKSFALEAEAGKPESRRWVETRFLTKQDGEWYGYSYVWDDAQADATLVGAAGTDREYAVKDAKAPGGVRKQVWHYPSRAECMVCHSRAANFVLGLSEAQMNKDHDYGGAVDNQLRTWDHVGALVLPYAEEFKAVVRAGAKAKGMKDAEADAAASREAAARERRGAEGKDEMLVAALGHFARLANPYDAKADLTARARAYLQSNCAQCHVLAGGGNAQIELGFATPLKDMKLVDVKPQHHTFGLPEARLVAPGHPGRSVLLHRISHRGEGHMPPLSTNVVDEGAVELMREWIRSLKPTGGGAAGGR